MADRWRPSIGTILTLAVGLAFVLAAVLIVALVNYQMRQHALVEAEAKAQLLFDRNLATHAYFAHQLKPKVFPLVPADEADRYFEAAWMSSTFAVREIDKLFHDLNPRPYYYKEAAVNARSPENEADPIEREFLVRLNADPSVQRDTHIRSIDGARFLVFMRRGEVMEAGCLQCHSTAGRAPRDLTAAYGGDRSFGRRAGEVVSAISIRIPLEEAYASANAFSVRLSGWLLIVLAVLFGAQTLLQQRWLLAPLARLQRAVSGMGMGSEGAGVEMPPFLGRELADLAAAYNGMVASIRSQQDQLETRVRERTADLEQTLSELRDSIRMRWEAEEKLMAHARQMAVLNDLGRNLVSSTDPARVAERILIDIQSLIPGSCGRLLERAGDDAVQVLASTGLTDPQGGKLQRFRIGEGLAGVVMQSREPLACTDLEAEPRFANKTWARAEGLQSGVVLPLVARDELLGILAIFTRAPHVFTAEEMASLEIFSAHATIALANARLHEAIRRTAGELEQRVRERTAELETALRAKAEFLAKMSHELRTPLNFILGFTDLLGQGVAGPLNPKQAQFVERAHSGGHHLLRLVTDILELSSAEAGKVLRLEEVPMGDAVAETLELLTIQAEQKRLSVHVKVEPGLCVVADRPKLKQVLTNLLGNAVKFSPDGGRITVAARRISDLQLPICDLPSQGTESQSQIANQKSQIRDFVEIAVEDTGIGIAPENLERIFRGFEQVDSSATRQYGGAGIGLALVRTLVQLHGGQVWAESPGVGRGTRFVVHLPPLEAPLPARILIVEDNSAVAQGLVAFLSRAGYAVQVTGTGSGALAAIRERCPDLVVLDIGLPDMSGWDVLQEIRMGGRGDPKVLVMTGMGSEDSEKAKAMGADEFLLTKPVSAGVVTGIVRGVLAKR